MFLMLHCALTTLLAAARVLFGRPLAPVAHAPHENPPPRRDRVATAIHWLEALASVLSGDSLYLIPFAFPRWKGRFPSLTAALREEIGLPAIVVTPAQREAARRANRLHYMRKVFATRPTGRIVALQAARLGLSSTSPDWPAALIAITEPPAALARQHPKRPPAPTATPSEPATQGADPPATPFHPRE